MLDIYFVLFGQDDDDGGGGGGALIFVSLIKQISSPVFSLYLRNVSTFLNGWWVAWSIIIKHSSIDQARTIWLPCSPAAVDRDGTARAGLALFGAWATVFRPRSSAFLPLL